jgi:hypothetical protein
MRLGSTLALATALALIGACATRFVNTWKSPEWTGPPLRNLLVVGNAPDGVARRAYEDAMGAELAKIGVRAEPSYRVLPGESLEREAVARAVVAGGHDGLVTARLVGVDQRATYVAGGPTYGPYVGWRAWGGFYEPGYVKVDQIARIETQVWALAGQGTMIWAGVSETVNPREIPNLAKSLAAATVGQLEKAGILPEN